MPRLVADIAKCQAYGACVAAAPEVFDLDEDGVHVVLLQEIVTDADQAGVALAVEACPMQALRVTET
ncbi:ferredoxin [Streptomyces sp. NPDC001982]|uniref:ferredoxin n=1 Tax=Streptomyces sp. NPDC001982 TaxID=3154405 RepID=UPI00332B5946